MIKLKKDMIVFSIILIFFNSPSFAIMPGDANLNGKIDVGDAIIILQTIAGLREVVTYSNGTLSGNWITSPVGTGPLYLSADGNGTLTDISGINMASPPGNYEVSSNGSLSMSLTAKNGDVFTGAGTLTSSTSGTITFSTSSDIIGTATLSKIINLSLFQGNYSGTISKAGETYNVSFTVDSSGTISNFISTIPGVTTASGKAYAVGSSAIMMIRTNLTTAYSQIHAWGTLADGQFNATFENDSGTSLGTMSLSIMNAYNNVRITGTVSGATFYAVDENDTVVNSSVASGNPKQFIVDIPGGNYKFVLVENEGSLNEKIYLLYQGTMNVFNFSANTQVDLGFVNVSSGKAIPTNNPLNVGGVSAVGESKNIPMTLYGIDTSKIYIIPTYNIVIDGNKNDWESTPGFIDHENSSNDVLNGSGEPKVWIHIAKNAQNNILYFGFYFISYSDPSLEIVFPKSITLILNNKTYQNNYEVRVYPEYRWENGSMNLYWVANIYDYYNGTLIRAGQVSVGSGFYEASFDIDNLGIGNGFVIRGKSTLNVGGSSYVDYFGYNGIINFN